MKKLILLIITVTIFTSCANVTDMFDIFEPRRFNEITDGGVITYPKKTEELQIIQKMKKNQRKMLLQILQERKLKEIFKIKNYIKTVSRVWQLEDSLFFIIYGKIKEKLLERIKWRIFY